MDLKNFIGKVQSKLRDAEPIKGRIKVSIESYPSVILDGTTGINQLLIEDGHADCIVEIDLETLDRLQSGKLNPVMAIMRRKIKIKGKKSLVLELVKFLS